MNTFPETITHIPNFELKHIHGVHKSKYTFEIKQVYTFLTDEGFIFGRGESPRPTESSGTFSKYKNFSSRIMIIEHHVTRFGFNMLNSH